VNTENVKAIAQLQYNYKLQEKENVNQVLLKDKKLADTQILLQKLTIQRQYAIGAFIGIGLLSFVVLSVFYYRSLQTKKKDNELLYTQQQEILEQNQEIITQNEEIFIQKEHLSQLNNTKDKLFSIISHDLRSPVLTLQEALTMFNSDLLTQEEIGPMSDELLKNVKNTSAMLDNVLFWAKNQMEGIYIKKEIFNIRQMIIANFINFDKQSSDKKIMLINSIAKPINVIADAGTIDIVVRNLLSNAIKFCRAGDSITISATVESRFLYLSVADTGTGMSKEVQQKLFNSADYYSTHGTANETGTGLGLNLCVEFVTLNGGSIWVESELGKGSTFTFTIPIA
jgi:signal transduction histidine kinase